MKVKPIFVIIYIFLAIIIGWTSYFCRPLKADYAAKIQQDVWDVAVARGKGIEEKDYLVRIYSSRILYPALMQIPMKMGISAEKAFALIRLLTIFISLILFHLLLLEWFSDELAFCGTLFMAATLPLTFSQPFEIPTDFPEIIVFTLGIWAIYHSKYSWLYILVLIGSLSRETTAVLPFFLFFKLFNVKSVKWLVPVFISGLCWLIPLIFLRLWVGVTEPAGYGHSIEHNIPGLLQLFTNPHPYNNYLFWFYLFGAFWFIPFWGWKNQPLFFKRLLMSLPIYVTVYFFAGGFLDEPRELVNLYPLIVPASLIALFPNSTFIKKLETSKTKLPEVKI